MARKGMAVLIVSVLLLGAVSGCAGVPTGSGDVLTGAVGFLPESFSLKLPPIYLQYVETADGSAEPSVLGLGASLLEAWFGLDLGMVKIPAFYVDWMKASNVQHLEIVTDPEGVFAYANGKATPYLAWDADSLALAANVVDAFGVANVSAVKSALPWVTRIGLDIVVQLPLAEGAEFIPFRDMGAPPDTTEAAPEIEKPSGEIKLQIDYDEAGVPSLLGLPVSILQPIIGTTPGQLDPQMLARLKQAGVQSLTLKTRGDGLFIFVNDQALPNVAWDKEHLSNALDIYAKMNETSWMANAAFVSMIREIVQQTTNFDIELAVNFL
jgi:hypothetical protein